ncbi:MAG: PQQ-binding-like beta-propeller repeat protein [Bacillota bacterium]
MRIRSKTYRTLSRAILLALACALLMQPAAASAAAAAGYYQSLGTLSGKSKSSFEFVVASDSHVGYGPATRATAAALADMASRYPDLSFMIHMGDLTETGSAAQYDEAKALLDTLDAPVFGTLGNHESRWQDPQGSLFRSRFGSPNTSFNWGAWHFVVLDTTYPGETLGTLDPETVAWLRNDLTKNPGRPVAVFSHHPLLYQEVEFQDSDAAFAQIMDEFPVRVVFSGHGHSFITWEAQGQKFQMVGALMDGAYAVASVNGRSFTVKSVTPGPDGAYVEQVLWRATVPTASGGTTKNPVTRLDASIEEGTLNASFRLSRSAEAYFQIDNGSFVPLGQLKAGANSFTFDVSKHALGRHTLTVKTVTANGPYFKTIEFAKIPEAIEIWRAQLGSSVTGSIVIRNDAEAVIGTRDGIVRAVRLSDGKTLWSMDAGSQWGGGFIDGARLYFGTANGDFYCVDAASGSLRWRTRLDPSGFVAAPVVANSRAGKRVVAVSTSGKAYCLDAVSAAKKWKYEAKGAIVNPPVAQGNTVFFGSWDTNMYAVDLTSGALLWSVQLGRQVYYAPYLTPAVSGDTVYTVTAYDATVGGSFLFALDVSTGAVKWKATGRSSFMSPWAAPDHPVTVMDGAGTLWAFSQTDGQVLWSKPGSSTLFGDAQGNGSRFVTGGYRGVVGLTTESNRWDFVAGDGHLFVSPALVTISAGGQSRALVADTRGNLYFLALPE